VPWSSVANAGTWAAGGEGAFNYHECSDWLKVNGQELKL